MCTMYPYVQWDQNIDHQWFIKRYFIISVGDPDPLDPWPFLEDPGSGKIMPY